MSAAVGSATRPVYFEASGIPKAINYTIQSNVPANAKFTDTTYAVFGRSANGLVPHPTTTTSTRFLREDGSWVIPTNTTYSLATTSKNGLLRQLDGNTTHFLRGDGTWQSIPHPIGYYTATNPSIPGTNTKFFWSINASTHQLTHYPIIQIFEVATGEMVLADVEVDSSYNVIITMVDTTISTIRKDTYRVVMVG